MLVVIPDIPLICQLRNWSSIAPESILMIPAILIPRVPSFDASRMTFNHVDGARPGRRPSRINSNAIAVNKSSDICYWPRSFPKYSKNSELGSSTNTS
ncbi:MAG: hypothetical protein ACI9H8_002544, partial [Lysobacterales bacterium]